jgi:hypothetical protein
VSVEALVEQQAGVVSHGQALACGMSASTVRRWVREGRWRRVRPGVYLVGGQWDLLRFTWHGLDTQPVESVREITDTLARAA